MEEFDKTIDLFIKAFYHYRKFESEPVEFSTDDLLYPAEIHFLEYIGMHPYCSLTETAQGLEITKGAVSQLVKKMVNRGYLLRLSENKGGTQAGLFLSEKGREVQSKHETFHRKFNDALLNALSPIKDSELAVIKGFLMKFLQFNW